jgi:hypothetical protein
MPYQTMEQLTAETAAWKNSAMRGAHQLGGRLRSGTAKT